jgi:hypothetical protein
MDSGQAAERQTDRQTARQTDSQTEREREETCTGMGGHIDKYIDSRDDM